MQIQPQFIIGLVERFNNKKWEKFNSEKVCHISYARIQVRQQSPCFCQCKAATPLFLPV
jgi:hypothetical protein